MGRQNKFLLLIANQQSFDQSIKPDKLLLVNVMQMQNARLHQISVLDRQCIVQQTRAVAAIFLLVRKKQESVCACVSVCVCVCGSVKKRETNKHTHTYTHTAPITQHPSHSTHHRPHRPAGHSVRADQCREQLDGLEALLGHGTLHQHRNGGLRQRQQRRLPVAALALAFSSRSCCC